ncbi:MAG TPA: hypothetical protein DD392_03220 [Ruminococcus sp.]|nr:hypothetical protein [Ruminococcus sp.]
MAYADFGFYLDFYAGSVITDEKIFRSLAERASDFIDTVTFDRVKNEDCSKFQDKIKRCCCAVAEKIYRHEKPFQMLESGLGVKLSEKIGEYSVTNANPYEYIEKYSSEQLEKLMKKTALRYLGNTGLMYRGCD